MHNIFGDRFGDARRPAWHELGTVFGENTTATDAFGRIGEYKVTLESLQTKSGIDLRQRAIVRHPTKEDNETRIFGVVGPEYQLVSPQDACSIFDERVGVPVETIGALGYGETLFISTTLPTIDVKGDEVGMYLLLDSPMTGLKAADVMTTPIRTVCQNTLMLARSMACKSFKVVHDATVKQRLGDWLQHIYEEAEMSALVIKEAFDILANTKVTSKDVTKVLNAAYPIPRRPLPNAPVAVLEQRNKWWDENASLMRRRQEGARELFEGAGTGMDLPAAKGTAWGLYNAVVETEDFRRGRNDEQIAESALYGERAKAKERAFKAAHDLSLARL